MSEFDKYAGKAIHRKIRKLGQGTWVIPLPKEYGAKIQDNLIDLYFLNGTLVVNPFSVQEYFCIGYDKLETVQAEELEAKVKAYFLAGYDELELDGYREEIFKEKREKISDEFPRIKFLHNPAHANKLQIKFYSPEETPEQDVELAFALTREYADYNKQDMADYPNISTLDGDNNDRIPPHHLEEEIDEMCYSAKRRLAVITTRPSIYEGVKTGDVRNIFDYYLLMMNLERLADIEDGISRHIKKLKEMEAPTNLFKENKEKYSILQYYNDATQFLENAFEKRNNREEAYNIIATKRDINLNNHTRFRGDYIPCDKRESIIEMINELENVSPYIKWRANLLERSIWGITNIAVNIAELWQNLNRNEPQMKKYERLIGLSPSENKP